MANYYDVVIRSEKMTQKVASEIFKEAVKIKHIRYFSFCETNEGGYLTFNSHGLPDIGEILDKYDFTEAEIEVKDESDTGKPLNIE